jgi:hypothetical protein
MAKAKEESKAVVPTKGNLPAEFLDQVALDAGKGAEEATSEDMAVPFMKIAQALSPEVNKRESTYIEGLEVGDFFNTATQVVYGGEDGFYFIPVKFVRKYLEWTPRDKGGGFNGEHGPEIMEKTTAGEKGENWLQNGNEIVITGTWFGLVIPLDGSAVDQAVVSLSKTQLKKSRNLMTKLKQVSVKNSAGRAFNPPIFYSRIKVTSVPESNDQGNWMGWKFDMDGTIFDLPDGGELYDSAKLMLEAVSAGRIRTADPGANAPDADGDDGGESRRGGDPDKEIPF